MLGRTRVVTEWRRPHQLECHVFHASHAAAVPLLFGFFSVFFRLVLASAGADSDGQDSALEARGLVRVLHTEFHS